VAWVHEGLTHLIHFILTVNNTRGKQWSMRLGDTWYVEAAAALAQTVVVVVVVVV